MARETANQHSLTYDLFHTLSQPLTALQCSLELALVRDRTAGEFRASVEAALENAERLRQSFLLLRELNDADDPGDISAPVDLRQVLLELGEDFLPIFESAGGQLDVTTDAVQIRGNTAKLKQAFFYLIDYLLGVLARPNLSIRVQQRKEGAVEVRMTLSSRGHCACGGGPLRTSFVWRSGDRTPNLSSCGRRAGARRIGRRWTKYLDCQSASRPAVRNKVAWFSASRRRLSRR